MSTQIDFSGKALLAQIVRDRKASAKRVAWRRSQSTYNYGPPSTIHLLPQGATKALCGVEVPKEARPGYVQPQGLRWFEIHVTALDVDDDNDFFVEKTGETRRTECKRCQKASQR